MIPLILFMAILDNDKNTDVYSNNVLIEECENHNLGLEFENKEDTNS